MRLFSDAFGGIDFSDSGVRLFFAVFIVVVFFSVLLVFFVFKLFIPKSKMQDIEAIERAIVRLERLMLFDRVMLVLSSGGFAALLILHFAKVIDIFHQPFSVIVLICASVIPIFLVAVFGRHSLRSGNRRKLDELRSLLRDARANKRDG